MPRVVREHEILRLAAIVQDQDKLRAAEAIRREVLVWTQNKGGGRLPQEAWAFDGFDYFSGGRNSSAIRIKAEDIDIWTVRADDPDKNVPGRVWTTEILIGLSGKLKCFFTTRLLVSTSEDELVIEPHVPGVVQQVVERCLLSCGPIDLSPKPWLIESEDDVQQLIDLMIDRRRTIPLFVLTVPDGSIDPTRPLLDAFSLARATIGIGKAVILPAAHTWALTERLGRQRSVFGGAVRAYLSRFSENSDPYQHRLVLSDQISTPEGAAQCAVWMRSLAAAESIRRTRLGADVLPFMMLRNLSLKFNERQLEQEGASDVRLLDAAKARIEALEADLKSAIETENYLLEEHRLAEERAAAAETQLNAASYRIRQLLDQIKQRGQIPDANIPPPQSWTDFNDWCDLNLAGRVVLAPPARNGVRRPAFEDVALAARCLLWLANEYRDRRLDGGEGSLRDHALEAGVRNSPSGADEFRIWWQGQQHTADWHIKNGGNTRDPRRCLRIYYFWEPATQQVVVADMPSHRTSSAS
jgi:hypothetical protein